MYLLSNAMDTRTYPVPAYSDPAALAAALLLLPLPARYGLSPACARALAEGVLKRGAGSYGNFWTLSRV